MWDALYVLITIVFFAAMLWYVFGAEWLGGRTDRHGADRQPGGDRRQGETRER